MKVEKIDPQEAYFLHALSKTNKMFICIQRQKILVIDNEYNVLLSVPIDESINANFHQNLIVKNYYNNRPCVIDSRCYQPIMFRGELLFQIFDKVYVLKSQQLYFRFQIPNFDFDCLHASFGTMYVRGQRLFVSNTHQLFEWDTLGLTVREDLSNAYPQFFQFGDLTAAVHSSKVVISNKLSIAYDKKFNKFGLCTDGAIVLHSLSTQQSMVFDLFSGQSQTLETHQMLRDSAPGGIKMKQSLEQLFGTQFSISSQQMLSGYDEWQRSFGHNDFEELEQAAMNGLVWISKKLIKVTKIVNMNRMMARKVKAQCSYHKLENLGQFQLMMENVMSIVKINTE